MIATTPIESAAPQTGRTFELLPAEQIGEGLATWKQVDSENPTPHCSASWPWVRAWIDAFGDTVDARIALWRDGETVIGCGLVVVSTNRSVGRIPLKTIHLGTTGEIEPGGAWAEYVTPWLRREHETAAFIDLLLDAADQEDWHRLDLDGIAGPLFDSIGCYFHEVERRESPWFDLQQITKRNDPQPLVLDQLGKSTKKNIKRRLNKYTDLTTTWVDYADESVLDELIRLHQARWNAIGLPGAFAGHRYASFVRSFVRLASNQDRFALTRVADAEGTVGCQLLIREEGRVLDLLSGFVDGEARPSPGLVCHFTNIVEAAKRGLDGYEFLVGDARVKRDLSNATRSICWAKQMRPTRRMKAVQAARQAVRFVKRLRPSRGESVS